nr:hypothetical protein LSAT_4X182480 [Tanacetum cinerariifolium]
MALSPSFNVGLEFGQNSQVNNLFEENEVIGITNYIDFGFELVTRIQTTSKIPPLILMHLGKPIKTSCRREKWGLLVQLSLFLLSYGGSLHSVSVCQMAPMHIKNAREVPEYEIVATELDFTGSVDITKKQKAEVGEEALKNLTLDSVKRRSIKPPKSLTAVLSAHSKLLVGLLQDQKILWSTLMHQTSTMN